MAGDTEKDKRKVKYYPCDVEGCTKDAIACLRPDMDIKGLCFCEEHRQHVYAAYLLALDGDVEEANKMLGRKAS